MNTYFVYMITYFVYMITNKSNKVVYIGVTNDLQRRVYEHKEKMITGFSQKYNTTKLVYFEEFTDIKEAILREKEIKKWRREKKDNLINTLNPKWLELLRE